MPEGPSLLILRELTQPFVGKRIRAADGTAKLDKTRLVGARIVAIRTWGKHFLIELDGFAVRIHLLFRIRLHPLSRVGSVPPRKLTELIKEARQYSFDFLKWKKAFELRKHWPAHTRRICPRCDIPFRKAHLGTTDRRSFYCERCQVKYAAPAPRLKSPSGRRRR